MKQLLFLCLSVMLLTNCVSPSTKQFIPILEGEKSAVFSKCNIKPSLMPCNSVWINQQTKEVLILKSSGSNKVHIIKPGNYSFQGFFTESNADGVAHSISNLSNIAYFSAYKGEVINIGTIEFDLRKNFSVHHAIAIFDDQNGSSQYLAEHEPLLLPRLKTQLIQLSPEVIRTKEMKFKEKIDAHGATAQKFIGL